MFIYNLPEPLKLLCIITVVISEAYQDHPTQPHSRLRMKQQNTRNPLCEGLLTQLAQHVVRQTQVHSLITCQVCDFRSVILNFLSLSLLI